MSPGRTPASVRTSPLVACAQMLQGLTRRISSSRLAGVLPKPMAMASPSGQNASSPSSTTAFASGSRSAETGAEKYAIKKLFLLGDHEADPEADTKTDEAHAKAKKPLPSKPDARGETPAKPTEREVAVTTGEATPRCADLGEPLTPGAELEVKMNEAQTAEELTRIAAGLAELAKTENIPAAELKGLRSVYAQRMNALLIKAGK